MEHLMKNGILTIATLALVWSVAGPAHARCVGPVVNGQCLGTNVGSPSTSSDQQGTQHNYRSGSGATYQYDLSRPGDSIQYQYDRDAQRRDQMNSDPRRKQDRKQNQFGGGINNGWGQ
jgi:hypothetical protein|tara:strand:- start:3425 stop:3778 length:354 start_codon:yes stop_codon:yes gene_type:complete